MTKVGTGKRKKSSREEASGPSLVFMIALAIGLALLAWLFWIAATNPEVHQPPGQDQAPVEEGVRLTEPSSILSA